MDQVHQNVMEEGKMNVNPHADTQGEKMNLIDYGGDRSSGRTTEGHASTTELVF